MANPETALIVGTGPGLSASLARLFRKEGMQVALAARDVKKITGLVNEVGAKAFACDASSPKEVESLFGSVAKELGDPNLVVYNASARTRGPLVDLDVEAVRQTIAVTCYGGFLIGQAAAKRMLKAGGGTILFTGASASVKGYANSAAFAMGKMGLTGLVQSMARELQPKNIHVAQVVIDGGINEPTRHPERAAERGPDGALDPDAIAQTYLHLHQQHRSAWAYQIDLRPWVERF